MYPELIFKVLLIILLGFFAWYIKTNWQYTSPKKLVLKMAIIFPFLFFCWIWFVPIHIGQRGESPVCRFRFQVFEYEIHDYSGNGDIKDIFFKTVPKKYGSLAFYKKVGGWKEYFGIKSFKYETDESYFGKEVYKVK